MSLLKKFPVQIALGAWLVYLVTLVHDVTLNSLALTAQVSGWDWQPVNSHPLLWLLTAPVHLLPAAWTAPALNLISAALGAITLGVLARSLELADWDRPLKELGRWQAKLPLLLGCAVCGLEFNFWQEATAATGEMLQVLLFALSLLLLLQFRATRDFRRLQAAALVWGAGMAENWFMLLSLPVFLIALLWLGRAAILNKGSLLRLALAGLAGFLVVALWLPLWNSLWPGSPWGFGEAWLNFLKGYTLLLQNLYAGFFRAYKLTSLAVVIFFLLPLLPSFIRKRDQGTMNLLFADQFQVWIYRGLRIAVMLACLWLAFDPVVGPRQIALKQTGYAFGFLSLDYLTGFCAGFILGNLLLAASLRPQEIYRQPNPLELAFARVAAPAAILLFAMTMSGLASRNTSAILLANRQPLIQFGQHVLDNLAAENCIVAGDDPQRLLVLQAAAQSANRDLVPLDMRLLSVPAYRKHLARRHPCDWIARLNSAVSSPAGAATFFSELAASNNVYFFLPSFSPLSESFSVRPSGVVGRLSAWPEIEIEARPLSAETIARNEQFWNDIARPLAAISETGVEKKGRPAGFLAAVSGRLHLQPVKPLQSRTLAGWYSAALTDWGVRLQRAGRLDSARQRFEQAIRLNPENAAAGASLVCNSNLVNGATQNLAAVEILAGKLGNIQSLAQFIRADGPADEPAFCYLLGNVCARYGLTRLAIQQFERAGELAAGDPAPQLALIRLYSGCGRNETARALIQTLREDPRLAAGGNPLATELDLLEVGTWLNQTNTANARGMLRTMLEKNPRDARIADLAARAYLSFGDQANALKVVRTRLAEAPDDFRALLNQASIQMNLGQPASALPVLDHALSISNFPPIRFARAVARTRAGQFQAAEADYLELEKTVADRAPVYGGLAGLALQRQDTNLAIQYLEKSLSELSTNSPQYRVALASLERLKAPGL